MTSHDDLIARAFRLLRYHRQRIWWITSRVFVLTVAITALGLAVSPQYVARASFTLLPTRSEIGYASMRPDTSGVSPATMLGQTHVETMLSRTLAEDVARAIQAEAAPAESQGGILAALRAWVISPLLGGYHRGLTLLNTGRWETPDPLLSLAQGIQGRTRVQNVAGSFVFQVGVTWDNPHMAARIANLLTDRYVAMALSASQEEMHKTREYVEARVKETQQSIDDVVSKIKDYRATEQIYTVNYNTSADLDLRLQEMSQYVRDLNGTRVSQEQLTTRINALKAYQTPPELAAIEAERAGLSTRRQALDKVISEQAAKLETLPAKEAGLLDLYRDRTIAERNLGALQDRLLDTKVAEAAQLSAVRVIDKAIPPVYPESPLLLRNAVAALLVGLLLSAAFVVVSETRHPGVRCRDDFTDAGAAVLGVVPYVAAGGNEDPDAAKAGRVREFFRGLIHGPYGTVAHRRTTKRHVENIWFHLTESAAPRIGLFVSLNGGEGKTYLIENLARVAAEAGRKILLIDANFGAPALHLRFGQQPAAGFAEMLAGNARAEDVIVSTGQGVDLIRAGLKRPGSQARWALEGVASELTSLAASYDLVLIECAGLRCDPAALRLLPLATDIVTVFDATTSQRGDSDDLRQRLAGAPGRVEVVLNKVLHPGDFLFTSGVSGHALAQLETSEPAGSGA